MSVSDVPRQVPAPAHILWRIAQGVIDDLIVTALAFGLAWGLGWLPAWENFRPPPVHDAAGWARELSRYLPCLEQAGGILALYIVLKFTYYVLFVAHGGRTLACYLLRLRLVKTDGTPVSWEGSLRRAMAGGFISHTPVIGHLLRFIDYGAALCNERKRAARDFAAGTVLVHDVAPENQ